MICINPSCKKSIPDGIMFCPFCGTKQDVAARRILIIAPETYALIKPKIEVYVNGEHIGQVRYNSTMYVEVSGQKAFFQFKENNLIGSVYECSCVWEASFAYSTIKLSWGNFTRRIKAQLI